MISRHSLSCSILVAALAGGLAVTPDRAEAARPYAPGEQQPLLDLKRGTWALYPEGEGQVVAQTFTPSRNQWLGYLQIPVGCASGVLLNVRIRDGLGGPILSEVNVSGLPEVVDGTLQLIQVFDPAVTKHGIRLKRGRPYSFELAAFPGPAATETTCGVASGPAADTYPAGSAYYEDVPTNGPGFVDAGEDLPFITLVR